MYPLISIIIPTKNEKNNITRCLWSIKNQNYKGKIEIIVVDNHSWDKTLSLAKNFTSRVYNDGNERSQQRNIGAKKAKGQWLLFIDADMELSKDVVIKAIELAQTKKKPPIITITEKAIGYTFLTKALALEKNCYNNVNWLIAARFFPRKEFLQLGGYDEELIAGEDWAITQMFRTLGYELLTLKKPYIIHHEAKDSLKKLLQKEMYYIHYIKRYADKYPVAFSHQSSLLYRSSIWIKEWKKLIKHPLLTITFLTYKSLVWMKWKLSK
jgi:glycosyltransferase involved in cell wall biosynthesis